MSSSAGSGLIIRGMRLTHLTDRLQDYVDERREIARIDDCCRQSSVSHAVRIAWTRAARLLRRARRVSIHEDILRPGSFWSVTRPESDEDVSEAAQDVAELLWDVLGFEPRFVVRGDDGAGDGIIETVDVCGYVLAFRGPCQVVNCDEHNGLSCVSCDGLASHECADTMGLACGLPLCDDCVHRGTVHVPRVFTDAADEPIKCGTFDESWISPVLERISDEELQWRMREHIGHGIRALRVRRDMSLRELADLSGMSVVRLGEIERAKQSPVTDTEIESLLFGLLGMRG